MQQTHDHSGHAARAVVRLLGSFINLGEHDGNTSVLIYLLRQT